MLVHVSFADLRRGHLEMLARSLEAAPDPVRPTDLLSKLRRHKAHCFEWDEGLVIASNDRPRLNLDAFCCGPDVSMEHMRQLAADLKRLAADWQCDTIATIVFDPRLASVIQHLGGAVESWALTLAVE